MKRNNNSNKKKTIENWELHSSCDSRNSSLVPLEVYFPAQILLILQTTAIYTSLIFFFLPLSYFSSFWNLEIYFYLFLLIFTVFFSALFLFILLCSFLLFFLFLVLFSSTLFIHCIFWFLLFSFQICYSFLFPCCSILPTYPLCSIAIESVLFLLFFIFSSSSVILLYLILICYLFSFCYCFL